MAEARFKYPESDAARPRGEGGAARHVVSGGREGGRQQARDCSDLVRPLRGAASAGPEGSVLLRRPEAGLSSAGSEGVLSSSAGCRPAYPPPLERGPSRGSKLHRLL